MSFWDLLGGLGGIAGGYQLAKDIKSTGDTAASDMGTMAGQLAADTAFKGLRRNHWTWDYYGGGKWLH